MRPIYVLAVLTAVMRCAVAEGASPPAVVQEFSGSGPTTTGFFKVSDHWEVRWNARQVVSVAVMSKDGTIVAGAAGVLRGSLFVPLGGEYYLKIADGTGAQGGPPAPSTSAPAATTNSAPPVTSPFGTATPTSTNASPARISDAPPPSPPVADAFGSDDAAPAETPVSWHLQVIQFGASVSASEALTVYTPFFTPPDTAVTPAPPAGPPPVLTTEQAQTVVKIKGDAAQGTGFLVRTADGPGVMTHLHLLESNPNCKIFTLAGVEIPVLGLKGATDRDLALFAIKDDNYSYLPLDPATADKLDSGDALIIPDVAGATDPIVGKAGRVIGATAERIDFDNPVTQDDAGTPVILAKGGSVVAVVTAVKGVDVSRGLAQAWAGNPPPGSEGIIPCFGVRTTGVAAWETYDPQRFLDESLFLQQFHHTTRCLDSFLNGRRRRRPGESEETGPPDIRYFRKDEKLKEDFDTYQRFANDADSNQRMEAAHELLFDLQGVAATDVNKLSGMTGLYAYHNVRAEEELAYRAAIRKQLDGLSNNLRQLDDLARSR